MTLIFIRIFGFKTLRQRVTWQFSEAVPRQRFQCFCTLTFTDEHNTKIPAEASLFLQRSDMKFRNHQIDLK